MAWQTVSRGNTGKPRLAPDVATLTLSGERARVSVSGELAARAGLNGRAVVMTDDDQLRIGLRAPDSGESAYQLSRQPGSADRLQLISVQLARWPRFAAGHYSARIEDGVLVIDLSGADAKRN